MKPNCSMEMMYQKYRNITQDDDVDHFTEEVEWGAGGVEEWLFYNIGGHQSSVGLFLTFWHKSNTHTHTHGGGKVKEDEEEKEEEEEGENTERRADRLLFDQRNCRSPAYFIFFFSLLSFTFFPFLLVCSLRTGYLKIFFSSLSLSLSFI